MFDSANGVPINSTTVDAVDLDLDLKQVYREPGGRDELERPRSGALVWAVGGFIRSASVANGQLHKVIGRRINRLR